MRDVRYALRTLLRTPTFAAVAILTLALGIGANTAMFSLVNAVLFRALPLEDARGLVSIFTTDARNPGNLPVSHLNYRDIRAMNTVFTNVSAFGFGQMNFDGGGVPEPIQVQVVAGNYFDVLGVKPAVGRTFLPEEDATLGSHPVTVLSYGFWQRQFGGNPAIVGQDVTLNRQKFSVIGVAPRGFDGVFIAQPDVWVPMMMHDLAQPGLDWYETRRGLFLFPFGRLKPGVSLDQARASLTTLANQLELEYPSDNRGRSVALLPLLEARINADGQGQLTQLSTLLMAVVGAVLLVACANMANLLLARASGRQKEIAVRIAIGASRARLVRQLLIESLTLSVLGGLAGLLLAHWTLQLLVTADLPLPLPAIEQAQLDLRVLAFAALASLATGLLFGLVPALHASRPDVVPVLKDATAAVGRGLKGLSLRKALIAGEVALSLAALVAAALFARSLQRTLAIDPGFETDRVVVGNFNLGREGYTQERGSIFHEQLADRLAALPGATGATVAQNAPFDGGISRSILLEGQDAADRILVQENRVTPGYFETLGVPIIAGRDFTRADRPESPQVVIINERMAAQMWPGQDAVGKRFHFFGEEAWTEVVGIVQDAKYNNLAEEPIPFLYEPLLQDYAPAASLHVRTSGPAAGLVSTVQQAVREMDPSLALFRLEPLSRRVEESLDGPRANVVLLAVFGLLALVLAAIGIYGVTSYTVSQQTREIGIRMALGAGRTGVMALVFRQAMVVVGIGLITGMILAAMLARAIQSLLVETTWMDFGTYLVTAAILALVAAIATIIPASRATRIDPLIALRSA